MAVPWRPHRHRRDGDGPAILCAVLLAISIGMLAAWVYGIIRLMEIQ